MQLWELIINNAEANSKGSVLLETKEKHLGTLQQLHKKNGAAPLRKLKNCGIPHNRTMRMGY